MSRNFKIAFLQLCLALLFENKMSGQVYMNSFFDWVCKESVIKPYFNQRVELDSGICVFLLNNNLDSHPEIDRVANGRIAIMCEKYIYDYDVDYFFLIDSILMNDKVVTVRFHSTSRYLEKAKNYEFYHFEVQIKKHKNQEWIFKKQKVKKIDCCNW